MNPSQKDKNLTRYYIMPEIWKTVSQSQVFGWLELLNKSGYPSSCISLVLWKSFFRSNKEKINKVEITKKIGGKFYEIPVIDKPYIFDVLIVAVLFYFWMKKVLFSKRIIFQTRLQNLSYGLSFINLFPKVKIILDARGAFLEEATYQLNLEELSFLARFKYSILTQYEKQILKSADKVFCVSEKLRDYYIQRNNKLSLNKFIVIPGAADSKLFTCNSIVRNSVRAELGLEKKIVLIYSGRLDQKWQLPDKIFEMYKLIFNRINNAVLLLVTPDREIVERKKIQNSFRDDQVISVEAKYESVNRYLNAADFALLLRDDRPINYVASPTKFAEYILCGLPVVLTNKIGDFSEAVKNKRIGYVINNIQNIEAEIDCLVEFISSASEVNNKQLLHEEIVKWGKENLSKDVYLNKIIETLATI